METLILRSNAVFDALERLKEARSFQHETTDNEFIRIIRDSIIKRFELCYEVSWKFFKHFLNEIHGLEVASPKSVFNELYTVNIISQEESSLLFDMIRDRNQTSHIYREEVADIVAHHTETYLVLMTRIMQRCIKNLITKEQ